MRSRNEPCWTELTTAQMHELAAIITDDHGSMLPQPKLNDIVLMLFEDIAGLDMLTDSQRNRILKTLWSRYQRSNSADQPA